MEFELDDYPKNDNLKYIRIVSDILQHKFVGYYLVGVLCGLLSLVCTQTYIFLKKFDGHYFIEYAPNYFMTIMAAVVVAENLYLPNCLAKHYQNFKLWQLKDANHKLAKQIQKESSIATIFYFAIMLLMLTGGYLLMVQNDNNDNRLITYELTKDWLSPDWKKAFSIFLSITCSVLYFVALAQSYYYIYGTIHIKFQAQLAALVLDGIHDVDDPALNYPRSQIKIKEMLIRFVERYVELRKRHDLSNAEFRYFVLLFVLTAILFCISLLFFYLTFSAGASVEMILLVSASLGIWIYAVIVGQQLEDVSCEVFDKLCNLNWYNWSKDNKRIYLMILMDSDRPIKFSFSKDVSVNYELGVSAAKSIYSILNILSNINFN